MTAISAWTASFIVSFDASTGKTVLHNYMDFTNLKDLLTLSYEVTVDGVMLTSGTVEDPVTLDLAPHAEKEIMLPLPKITAGKGFLKLSYIQATALPLVPAGHILGFDELPLVSEDSRNQKVVSLLSAPKTSTNAAQPLAIRQDDHYLTIFSPNFCYSYDKLIGVFTKMVYKNQSLLDRPMEYNIWRAPTDNDRNIKNAWLAAQFDRTMTRSYQTDVQMDEHAQSVQIRTTLSMSACYIQRILNMQAVFTITADGAVDVSLSVTRDPIFPMLPRFGIRLFLPKELTQVDYFGIGPLESYIDKRRAGYHGCFSSNVRAMHEDYLRPQENGSHYDCDYVTLHNTDVSLTAASAVPFSFNASVYTEEELTKKAHNYELEESNHTVFCIDYRQNGIGSNSCGPDLLEKYRLDETEFTFAFRLVPHCEKL